MTELQAWQQAARECASKGRWEEALRQWTAVRKTYGADLSGHIGSAQALRRLGLLDQAEVLVLATVEMFPNHVDPLVEQARIAVDRKDHRLALHCWERIRTDYPKYLAGWAGVAAALRDLGRLPEAEEAAKLTVDKFPERNDGYVEHARVAHARTDWVEAVRRWAIVRDKFPNFEPAYTSPCWALRYLKRTKEAQEILEAAMRLFPGYAQAAIENARLSQDLDDWPEARRRWQLVRDRFPDNPAGRSGLASALERTGDFAAAEQEITAALALFPNDEACLILFARLAAARSNWTEALDRWKRVLDLYPHSEAARSGFGKSRNLAALEAAMEAVPAHMQRVGRTLEPIHATEPQTVLARFESFGGNCELGLVQRHFGIEPLGLLRWTGTPPAMVAAALRARLEGVGDPENTTLKAINGEWVSGDARWHMAMHTFIPDSQTPYDVLFPRICRRLQFLKSKLVDDLHEGEKIFVYQTPSGVTETDIDAISEALVQFGDVALLCVRLASDQHPSGSVEQKRHRLYYGYIDRLGPVDEPGFPASWSKISFDIWLAICRTVLVLHNRAQTLQASSEKAASGSAPKAAAVSPPLPQAMPVASEKQLMLGFESLGDNCEFGLVQRQYDAEPLGLFRWAGISPGCLSRALRNRFEGFGESATTELVVGNDGDYYVQDKTLGYYMHTFLRIGMEGSDDVLRKQNRRLKFLAGKLLEDIADASKTFIYKRRDGIISSSEIMHIFEAVRSIGPATLLCVRLADELHASGDIETPVDGLQIGTIRKLSTTANATEIDFDAWLELCRKSADITSRKTPVPSGEGACSYASGEAQGERQPAYSPLLPSGPLTSSSKPKDYLAYVDILEAEGAFIQADSILAQAEKRFPENPALFFRRCDLIERRIDPNKAVERWTEATKRFPDRPKSYMMRAKALVAEGHFAAADLALEGAMRQFPDHPGIALQYAYSAKSAEAWPQAVQRFEYAVSRFPANQEAALQLEVCRQKA